MIVRRPNRVPRLCAGLLVAGALLGGCAHAPTAPTAPDAPAAPVPSAAPRVPATSTLPPAAPPLPTPWPGPSRASAAVEATTPSAQERDEVTLGVAVLDRATGEVATNPAGATTLRAASVAKLFTVVDVLSRRATGQVTVSLAEEQRIRRALGPSDDEAMNGLYSGFGGPEGIERVSALVGLTETRPPDRVGQWGEVETSARDVARLYGHVLTRLAPADRDLVLDALETAPSSAADGFDQGFGLLEPSRRGSAAAKQGWLCCLGSSIDLHSAGLPDRDGRYVVVLLSNQPRGYGAARILLDDAAAAARNVLDR